MVHRDYRIYAIEDCFDQELGATVRKWRLLSLSSNKRLALYKARCFKERNKDIRIEVICSKFSRYRKAKGRVVWSCQKAAGLPSWSKSLLKKVS